MEKRRPKVIEEQVKAVNKELARRGVRLESDELFTFYQFWLVHNGYYRGYNLFKRTFGDDGEYRLVLAGSYVDYDCLQFM